MSHVICKLKGHKVQPVQHDHNLFQLFECKFCDEKFTTDGYGRLVKFNSYWEKNHKFFYRHFNKRLQVR